MPRLYGMEAITIAIIYPLTGFVILITQRLHAYNVKPFTFITEHNFIYNYLPL